MAKQLCPRRGTRPVIPSIGRWGTAPEGYLPRFTYHLVAEADWPGRAFGTVYRPASLASEGFIHCTDGRDRVIETANRYYADDKRPYLLVTLDLQRVSAEWRYDDTARVYPHIYGPLQMEAVRAVEPLSRDQEGRFLDRPTT